MLFIAEWDLVLFLACPIMKKGTPLSLFLASSLILHTLLRFSQLIPLSFLLGFYMSLVMTWWWNQFEALTWPDELAMNLSSYLPGQDRARDIRRVVVRWFCLAKVLALRMVSHKVKKRFPSYQDIVTHGLMTAKEMENLKKLEMVVEGKHNLVWYPIPWAQNMLGDARREGLLKADLYHVQLL